MGEYRQRLRVLEVAQEQLEGGWEAARQEREAEWEMRLAAAGRAQAAVEGRCAVLLEGRLGEQRDAMSSLAGADARHLHE